MGDINLHPAAVAEARAAWQWYADRSTQAAAAFVDELDHAMAQIAEAPTRWPRYVGLTRRYLLHRFPFLVVYRERDGEIEVVAIAHGHRRPGYWQAR